MQKTRGRYGPAIFPTPSLRGMANLRCFFLKNKSIYLLGILLNFSTLCIRVGLWNMVVRSTHNISYIRRSSILRRWLLCIRYLKQQFFHHSNTYKNTLLQNLFFPLIWIFNIICFHFATISLNWWKITSPFLSELFCFAFY